VTDNAFDPERYETDQSFVLDYGRDLLDLLDPGPGERVLDVGCGTGHVTADIAARAGTVVGVDADPAMVDRAREAHPDLDVRVGEVAGFEAAEPFDAAFANAVLHWIDADDQEGALAAVAGALAPGGRFVAEMGAAGNVGGVLAAADGARRERGLDPVEPWYFPSLAEYATRLERAGFTVRLARTFERETTLSGADGLRSWLDQFGDGLFVDVTDPEGFVAAIEGRLRPDCYDPGADEWTLGYRRLQFDARLDGP